MLNGDYDEHEHNNEIAISRFIAMKLRSWRTGYQRVICLYRDHFTTLDPENEFRETNTFHYSSIARQPIALHQETDCLLIELVVNHNNKHVDKLKFRCEHRGLLLTELISLWTAFNQSNYTAISTIQSNTMSMNISSSISSSSNNNSVYPTFTCYRQRRMGSKVPCRLRVFPHALVEYSNDEMILQEYRYVHMDQVGFTVDEPSGIVIHTTGRGRLFFVASSTLNSNKCNVAVNIHTRSDLASAMKRAADVIGVPFVVGQGVMLNSWLSLRSELGSNAGLAICSYSVTKPTNRHAAKGIQQQNRWVVITEKFVMEKDAESGSVVSIRPLANVFAIVRVRQSETELRIEYKNGQSRTYFSSERDAFACSLLDACISVKNGCCITEEISDGYRLSPRGVEDSTKERKANMLESLFGSDSKEVWLLHRLHHISQSHANALSVDHQKDIMNESIQAALEFNANVPTHTSLHALNGSMDKRTIANVLPSIFALINYLLNDSNNNMEKSCATLLQTIYRIVRCEIGFQAVLDVPGALETLGRLLQMKDSFALFWSVRVLHALVTCPYEPRNREQEFVNKQLLLSRTNISESLISLLVGVGSASGGWTEGPLNSKRRPKTIVSDLILFAASEFLESVLCSGHDTTSPDQFEALIASLSKG